MLADVGPENLFTAEKLSLIGVLVAVIWMIMTRRLVPGTFYQDLKDENARLRAALDGLRDIGQKATGTAANLASQTRRHRHGDEAERPPEPDAAPGAEPDED